VSRNKTAGSELTIDVRNPFTVSASASTTGYLKTLDDFRQVPVGLGASGTPILLNDVARIQIGPEIRRGISELDGKGEAVGGVIVMRAGKNGVPSRFGR
jgi:Cu(I)/Ag(I) efflux system membrane protein CusA/SilA